jgi:hypothetical protein
VQLNDGRVFGGYTTSSWKGNGYGSSKQAFLFTLLGPNKQWNPVMMPCKSFFCFFFWNVHHHFPSAFVTRAQKHSLV